MNAITLVACGRRKQDRPAPARELHTGTLFRLARQAAEASGGPWYILSALHGLVVPAQELAPYEYPMPASASLRVAWALRVRRQLRHHYPQPARVVMLAPHRYAALLASYLVDDGWQVERPLQGLGIGQQQAALKRMT